MTVPESSNHSGSTGNPAGTPFFRLREIVSVLFFQPQLILVLAQDRCLRAFKYMTLFALFCGAVVGISRIPNILDASQRWAEWLGAQMGEVWLQDGTLGWEHPEETPHAARHGAWRVEFHDAEADFAADAVGPEKRGVWISPNGIYAWTRPLGRDEAMVRVLFANSRLFNIIDVETMWPDGFRLQGDELASRTRHAALRMLPAVIATEALRVFIQVLFYTLIFALIPYLLKSPLAAGGFRAVFTFYLYASIPPLIIASVYSSLNLPYLDFNTFFVGAFILYLIAVVWKIGRSLHMARNP